MKALIIGGLGFIGHHIALKLKHEGHEVYVVDAIINYLPTNFKTWNYYIKYRQRELENAGVHIIIEDIKNSTLNKTIHSVSPDWVINLASMPVALLADLNPVHAKNDIFDSNFRLLEVLKTSISSLKRYVYFSSSMVYGHFLRDSNGKIIPANEEQKCMPIDTYGAFKAANELLIQQYGYRYNLPYTIIRPSAVYGPTDCNLRVTELFLKKAFNNETIELDNGGQHELDFTYIDDLTQGVFLALTNENAINEVFNITYGNGNKISKLAEIVKKYFPDVKIRNNECKPYRPNRGALNITKAQRLLGYSPKYDLEQGIEQYIQFMKKHISAI
ncbi:MAG: NAD(P)-dependent oxidoreductase [Bacteroidales bacterium]|jgi:nucleoside-diphosphate-sugar epimerase|nr:NAD(P)-dependent oxidoreductase [Bacteroidales bacterium]